MILLIMGASKHLANMFKLKTLKSEYYVRSRNLQI